MTDLIDTNPAKSPTKPRIIKSFEPDPAVVRMLDRAKKDGIKLSHICNRALSDWLTRKGYARKKDIAA